MLSKGKVNFETEKRTDVENKVIELRELGYSGMKVREMLNIPKKDIYIKGLIFINKVRYKYPKTKLKAIEKLKYSLIDMALIHKMDSEDIQKEVNVIFEYLKDCQKLGNDRYKNTRLVLKLVETELSRKQIAEKLNISLSTISRIIRKGETK